MVSNGEEDRRLPAAEDRAQAVDRQVGNAGTMETVLEGTLVERQALVVAQPGILAVPGLTIAVHY